MTSNLSSETYFWYNWYLIPHTQYVWCSLRREYIIPWGPRGIDFHSSIPEEWNIAIPLFLEFLRIEILKGIAIPIDTHYIFGQHLTRLTTVQSWSSSSSHRRMLTEYLKQSLVSCRLAVLPEMHGFVIYSEDIWGRSRVVN